MRVVRAAEGWLAAGLLLAPAWLAVVAASGLAERVEPWVADALAPLAGLAAGAAEPFGSLLAGDYGLLTMAPLLFVWAAPLVLIHAVLLGAFQASGLLDRVSLAMRPLVRPFGLTGRDLSRVVMGFGCNVPAVMAARDEPGCSRGVCVSAIAFGSACSYQLGATLAVFAAAGRPGLVLPYLVYLGVTTLLYARWVSGPPSPFEMLPAETGSSLAWPSTGAVWAEARESMGEFFRRALPIFLVLALAATLLAWSGVLQAVAFVAGPAMAAFDLPAESATALALASIRKDGILLLAEPRAAGAATAPQLLAAVYLAGVLLPCLTTLLTVARERGGRFAARMAGRQAAAAAGFAWLLAWGGKLLWA